MKNFLDLQDTSQTLELVIQLGVIHDNGYPGACVRVNSDVVEYLQMIQPVEHRFQLSLLEPIEIEITMYNKQYSADRETALIIESVSIDGFDIVPNWTHLARYSSERGLQGPTSYLGINGSWQLTVDRPFYQWRHLVTGQGWLLEPISCEGSWDS